MNARNLLLAALVAFGLAHAASATPINVLLSSNGGIADINGLTGTGGSYDSTTGAPNLNDGNTDGNYSDGHIAHSSQGVQPLTSFVPNYMEVTIPKAQLLSTVEVFNRTDCCVGRIDNSGATPYTLTIYNGVPGPSTIAFTENLKFTPTPSLTGTNESGQLINLPIGGVLGDVVRITQNNNDLMNLAELKAFTPEPSSFVLGALGAAGLFFAARRRRLQTVLACCLAVVCLTHAASAATITWDTPAPISGPSDVARAGKLFDSIMFSSNNANASTTVNGVTFDRATTTGSGTLDSVLGHISTSEDSHQITNAPTTGNASYNALLSDESYNLPASPHNITLNGLGIGNTYLVQAWADDSTQNNPPQNSLSLNFGKADAVIVPNGDYIIGHFTADASTQVLTWGGSSAFYSTIDALQVQQLTPEPSSFVLGGLAAIGMLMAARRRRKV